MVKQRLRGSRNEEEIGIENKLSCQTSNVVLTGVGYEVSLFLFLVSVLLQVAMRFCKVQVIQSFVC